MPPTPLSVDEYVEQRHFFATLRERLAAGVPTQEALLQVREELLATTRLPLAVGLMTDELRQTGRVGTAMARLGHYFTPFQAMLMERAEEDRTKFDGTTAFLILERLAGYMAGDLSEAKRHRETVEAPSRGGLFLFQFETLARNRLGYDAGLRAMAADPFYDDPWRDWLRSVRRVVGEVELADLLYRRSEWFLTLKKRARGDDATVAVPLLFGEAEGRIANANRGKDPLHLFAALQRQLGYPEVPRQKISERKSEIPPAVEARLHKLEKRIQFLEAEGKGGLDLTKLAAKPDGPKFTDEPGLPPGFAPPG